LLGFYAAGLGIPFLLTALAFSRATTAFAAVRRHYPAIIAAGGGILVVMGVLVYTGELFQLNIEAQKFLDRFGLNFFSDV
jgi:cytochrome c-type biogenesis protein